MTTSKMRVYTKIHWNTILCGMAAVSSLVIVVLTVGFWVQTQSLTHMWCEWTKQEVSRVGSRFIPSELPFPEDLQPSRRAPRQVTNEKGRNIMIRKPKILDLQPRPADEVKVESGREGILARRAPQAILLGFAKCGTSALLEFLDLHPKIVSLNWEPDYFCDRMYPKYDINWYVNRMPPSYPDQITVEKSPCYIVEHDSHLRMHAMNSSLKVMVLVRDPIVRVLSEYGHYSATERYWGRTPTPLVQRITSRTTGQLDASQLLKVGGYQSHFEHLLKVFPREQVLVLDGDELITDPLSQIRKVESFLNVPHMITEESIYFDKDKGFYCMVHQDNGERKCLGKSKGREHEKLGKDLEGKLADFYLPYNEKLFELLGERFDWPK